LFSEPMQRNAWLAVNIDSRQQPEVQALAEMIRNTFQERREWFEPPT